MASTRTNGKAHSTQFDRYPSQADRFPPYDIPTEMGVLGAMILDNSKVPAVQAILTPGDFYRDSHEMICRAIFDLHAQGQPIDGATLADELKRRDQFQLVGGDDRLREIMDGFQIGLHYDCNAQQYAAIVRRDALSRAAIQLFEEGIDLSYSRKLAGPALLQHFVKRLAELGVLPAQDDDLAWIKDGYATLADAERYIGEMEYLWDLWIPKGAITAVTSGPGIGKTRWVAELCRRLWSGEPWPDGSPNPLPAGTRTLWLPYDRNWHGLTRALHQFGVPSEAVILPTRRDKPLSLPDFDSPSTMGVLQGLIEEHKPGMSVIDSTTYASAFNTGKPNEAKIAYDPIMDVLMETKQAGIGITHVNREGELLNRRFLERCRIKIKITRPDPTRHHALRIEVDKSDDKIPPPIGAILSEKEITYDLSPPTEPEVAKGRKASTSPGIADWLWTILQPGPMRLAEIIRAGQDQKLLAAPTAETPKPSTTPLYRAREWIARYHPGKCVEEVEVEDDRGRLRKHWQISDAPPGNDQVPY
jgi:hypothetical protein